MIYAILFEDSFAFFKTVAWTLLISVLWLLTKMLSIFFPLVNRFETKNENIKRDETKNPKILFHLRHIKAFFFFLFIDDWWQNDKWWRRIRTSMIWNFFKAFCMSKALSNKLLLKCEKGTQHNENVFYLHFYFLVVVFFNGCHLRFFFFALFLWFFLLISILRLLSRFKCCF